MSFLSFKAFDKGLPTRNWLTRKICLVLLVGGLATSMGCQRNESKKTESKVPEVEVSLPIVKKITDYEDFSGQTEAMQSINVQARVTGRLDKAYFKDGMEVKKGDLLFDIEPLPFQAELEKAQAAIQQAKAKMERLSASYKRTTPLHAKGVVSPEEYEKIKGEFLESQASLKAFEADLKIAQLNLDYCKVTAPIDGKISRHLVDEGNLIIADQTLLTTIVSMDPINVYFNLDERTLLKIQGLVKEGQVKSMIDAIKTVQIGLANDEGFPYAGGKIDFLDNKLDPGTGTLQVRAVFANPKGLLVPGLFVRIHLPIGEPHPSILISERALGTDQGLKFVYVVNDKDKVEYRKVKVGSLHDGFRVIEKGLAAGEKIIVNGVQKVRTGIQVKPRLVDMPTLIATIPPPLSLGPTLTPGQKNQSHEK